MFWLLEFLNFATILAQTQDEQILHTPVFFNFNEHISNFITSRSPTDQESTHNCLIVPCTVVDRQQNCMVITKRTSGGDCFTKKIKSNLNFTSEEDVVTLEFAYMAVHHPQAKTPYTGITIGWTNDDDDFYWIAAEDIKLITSGVNQTNQYAQFVTINSLAENIWTKVRTHIHLNNASDTFRVVFESFIDSADYAGQFLITNISIFDRGVCSPNCQSCLSFYECTSCESGRLYRGACLSDLCYFDVGLVTADKITVGWILQSKGYYGVQLKNIKLADCYQVKFIMNKANSNYSDSSSPLLQLYQYYFPINAQSLQTAGCSYMKVLPTSGQEGYSCFFEFYLLIDKTAVDLVNITWTQEFYYNQEKTQIISNEITGDNIQFEVLTQSTSLGVASTTVEGQVLLCQSSSCRSYYNEPQILYLNDPFYILVKLDEKYIEFGADFKFELVSAIALGNGTSVPLTIVNEQEKNMSATIYQFKVPYAVGNCTISITAQLVERPIDTTDTNNGRRLLSHFRKLQTTTNTTTQASSSGFAVSGQIKVEGFEILPGWIIYSKENVPYIIIVVSAGFILFLIFGYCVILAFWNKDDQVKNTGEQAAILGITKLTGTEETQARKKFQRFSSSCG